MFRYPVHCLNPGRYGIQANRLLKRFELWEAGTSAPAARR